ncbi:hypothetical protein [Aliivibrio logei]|uniref:MotA/TolQ/ExbB proton channel domain-containing protein n=1 Tax=Aliivibrio logei TaxID=688 RepID=A0A1B9NWT8_ALILO|nr:hypothetical protein [Aliivibrio logei]OCH19963.1 hypothetical protein A6E04_15525 [Aliivibrio logei]
MKYIGYILFFSIFIFVGYVDNAREFFLQSVSLAPEITYLVVFFYCYIILLAILLGLFPQLVEDRTAVFDSHLKMACSVMVSLGLVGTFVGLVDMISGIGTALSGGETDFAKKMESLLGAISSSLGAMSFAFMTSILGVGISAYSLVAGNFVSTAFEERKKKQNNRMSFENTNEDAYLLHKKNSERIFERLEYIEEKIINIKLDINETESAPYALFNEMIKQNEQLLNYIKDINSQQIKSNNALENILIEQVNQSENSNNLLDVIKLNITHLDDISKSTRYALRGIDEFQHKIKKLFY